MAIRFESTDSRFVRLDAVSYESEFQGWPRNSWLMIDLDAFDGRRRWQRLCSALETAEVKGLARYLRLVAEGKAVPGGAWGATEPEIELVTGHPVSADQFHVIVRLNSHFHPDWHGEEPCMREPLELPFIVARGNLLRLANDADEIAQRFPERPYA